MTELKGRQRRYLRGLGHHLKPVVIVGSAGPSDQVIGQVKQQLTAHELIKVKVLEGSRAEMKATAEQLGKGSNSHVAQVIGHTVLLFKPNPEAPVIELP